jgi:hypothetical protein
MLQELFSTPKFTSNSLEPQASVLAYFEASFYFLFSGAVLLVLIMTHISLT